MSAQRAVGTPLLRLTPPLGDTPPAPANLDALGDAAILQFDDSVARFSHADWERQQQDEPTSTPRGVTSPSAGRRPCQPTFVVLPFAQPTAFTAGCGLVRRSVSYPGTTMSVFFWHRTTLEPHARSGSAATATRCSPREPAFGTRATMACGGLKSVQVRRRMGYPWPKFWPIRGRSSSLFSRRATRPPRGPYEVLGACRFT